MRKVPSLRQLFLIEAALLRSLSREEVDATWDVLREFGLARLPYRSIELRLPSVDYLSILDAHALEATEQAAAAEKELRLLREESGQEYDSSGDVTEEELEKRRIAAATRQTQFAPYTIRILFDEDGEGVVNTSYFLRRNGVDSPGVVRVAVTERNGALFAMRALVVLLSARGVRREVKQSKLAKLGIGKNYYSRVTTLQIGDATERDDGFGAGGPRTPHLRRGHGRSQHYGPGNTLVKRVYIEATLVNAHAGWVQHRDAYVVRGGE